MRERHSHTALSDSVQHPQLPAGRHKMIGTEVRQETLPKRRRLVEKT